ncbi:Histidine kinase [Kriegella aquimaris]|uniref:Histidine kinase n=2 Tax=Kriegella aquimaris TaxID=192904 RepID=A0A1G9S653_9FLAO|nr:Histidine kinase [Kriegella aquimaris]
MTLEKKNISQILAHIFIWGCFCILIIYPMISQSRPIPSNLMAGLGTGMLLFYVNYFLVVPELLLKRNIQIYIAVSVCLIIVAALSVNFFFTPEMPENFPEKMMTRMTHRHTNLWNPRIFISISFIGIPYIISAMLRMYTEWKKNEDLRKVVEKQKIQSELQFLKTQLNPHFLFNSLNAIYALSVKQSPDTSQAIVDLAELMRYMLYEADKDLVPLSKELEYIKSYVQLQRLRLSDSENVTLQISGEEKNKVIPPLLFISFIENAFKYGTDYEGKTDVRINLLLQHKSIQLRVTNKIGVFKEPTKSSGVGLQNIKNRLKLLYPLAHELIVNNDGTTYSVSLTLRQ